MSGISGGALQAGSTSLILLLKSHKSRKALPMRRQRKTFVIWLMKQEKEVLSLSLSLCVFSPTIYGIFLLSCRIVGAVQPELMRGSSWPQVWQGQRPYRVEATAERDQATKFDSIVWKLICGHNGNENGKGNGWERERENGTTYKKPCMGCMSWVNVDREGSTWSASSRIVIENHQRHRSWVFGRCLPLSSPLFLSLSLSTSLAVQWISFSIFVDWPWNHFIYSIS